MQRSSTFYLLSLSFCGSFCLALCCDRCVVIRNGDSELLTHILVVFLGYIRSKLDFHGRNISALLQDIISHVAGGLSKIFVADGKGCNSASGSDAFLTADSRDLLVKGDCLDDTGVGCCSVIRRDVDRIILRECGSCNVLQVVGISEGVSSYCVAFILQIRSDGVCLVLGV